MIACRRASLLVLVAACFLVPPARAAEAPERARSEASASERARAEAFLGQWLAAWRAQDLDAYLSLYAADARVDSRDRAAFGAHKRAVFARGERPVIEVGDVEIDAVEASGERLLRVRFDQSYRAPSHADFGRKELLLRVLGGDALVVRETWTASSGAIDVTFAPSVPAAPAPAPEPAPAAPAPAADAPSAPLVGEAYVPPSDAAPSAPAAPAPADLLRVEPLLPAVPPDLAPVPGIPSASLEGGHRVVEEIVARVNGRVLTRSMFLERIGWYQDTLLAEDPPDLEQRMRLLAQETLKTTVDRWVLLQEAVERKADIEGFWRDWLTQFRKQVGASDMAELEALLAEQGTTIDRLKEQVVETEIPNLYLQQVLAGRLTFSEAELRQHFEAHRARFQPPASASFRQILVPLAPGADGAKASALAAHVVEELASGRDWCEVYAVYGQGGTGCGELDDISVADLAPELRDAVAGLPLRAVGKPVRSGQGLHVIQVLSRKGAEPVTFEEARDDVLRDLRAGVFEKEMEKVLADLRASAEIEISKRYQDAAAESAGPASASAVAPATGASR